MIHAKFSKTTGGVYPLDVYKTFPEDALDIPAALYSKFKNSEIMGFDVIDGKVVAPLKVNTDPREYIRVTAFQAHAAIARSGLYDAVTALMGDPDTPLEVKLAWGKASEFRRLSPVVLEMATKLELTDAQLDDLFTLAATIEA
jgi:hypothetical protein